MAATDELGLTVISASNWRVAQASRLLVFGAGGLGAAIGLGADVRGALTAYGIGAGAIVGLLFLYSLSASDLFRLEPPELDALPANATPVAVSRLLLAS